MAEVTITAEFWATVLEVAVAPGEAVIAGQELLVLESMKTEIPVTASASGTVARVLVAKEDAVDEGQALLVIEV